MWECVLESVGIRFFVTELSYYSKKIWQCGTSKNGKTSKYAGLGGGGHKHLYHDNAIIVKRNMLMLKVTSKQSCLKYWSCFQSLLQDEFCV